MADYASLGNLEYIEQEYEKWRQDPESVETTWRFFFEGFDLGRRRIELGKQQSSNGSASLWQIDRLIYSYRKVGHFIANINPLESAPSKHPDLELRRFGFTDDDLSREFGLGNLNGPQKAPLSEILQILRDTYCSNFGVEYMHILGRAPRHWLQNRLETSRGKPNFTKDRKLRLLKQLFRAELFETFVHRKFLGQKRFSLEGAEALIPALDTIREKCPNLGIKEIVLGMPHRGRLNVLANIVEKSFEEIFSEFEDNFVPDMADGSGDVKYHRGYSSDYQSSSGEAVHISLSSNPSHLEAVNPVTIGRARAKQRQQGLDRGTVLPVLIHGDAAFCGQGLVMETLQLSKLKGYGTGGSIHIIVNNQIGFTTDPPDGRSTYYPTDIAKMIEAPIFHVNGDDPEALAYCIELAMEFRQQFSSSVFINFVCYRKHGHNETDEPSYTQPEMYAKISAKKSPRTIYTEQLLAEGIIDQDSGPDEVSVASIERNFESELDSALNNVRNEGPKKAGGQQFEGHWSKFKTEYSHTPVATGVSEENLTKIVDALFSWPDGFQLNRKIDRQLTAKKSMYEGGDQPGTVDWAMAESLAIGSLLLEGVPVRLSGQDSRRGTFSQRHSVLYDGNDGSTYIPLNDISADQQQLCVYNSPLSEAAVLGFDYGYALVEPDMLILWEAQFGDFANGAQVIIDQFIISAEEKWQRAAGIVLLLPHGYEGMGPEHSSARLERFLQSCAEDNIQVGNFSTPAQYFHALRRQVKRDFRKPLVIMTPKSLLRNKQCVSPVSELTSGHFLEVIDDHAVTDVDEVRRIIFCSGKVYYDLIAARQTRAIQDAAIVRLEQFYPWPAEQIRKVWSRYPKVRRTLWVQEEPKNMGGWSFVAPLLKETLETDVHYVGRAAAASPATGSLSVHKQEQEDIMNRSFAVWQSASK